MATSTTSPQPVPTGDLDVDYRAVVVPLDGSDLAELAIEPARWLAEQFGAQLHFACFVRHQDELWWHHCYLNTLQKRIPHATYSCSQQHDPADAIVGVARGMEHSLVCMATHGRSRSAAVLGSTFSAVANQLPGPLLAIGPQARMQMWWRPEGISVCVDGTLTSERMVPLAAAWARRLRLNLDVLTVAEPAPSNSTHDAQRYVEALARRSEFSGLDATAAVLESPLSPHDGLARHFATRTSSIAAVASRVRRGFGRATHGSEAAQIIQSSPVPVLVQPVITNR